MWAINRVRRLGALLCVPVIGLIPSQVSADDGPRPDAAAAQERPVIITEREIDAARRRYTLPDGFEAATPAAPSVDIDALPRPKAPLDLEAIAEGYKHAGEPGGLNSLVPQTRLWVFISLGMPRPTLHRLIKQSARSGAVLVLRGLEHGSLRRTVAQVQELLAGQTAAVQVDPRLFDRYAIQQVPSFVLAKAHESSRACQAKACSDDERFVMTAGDVSLDYALDYMARHAPPFAALAHAYADRLGR